MSGSHRLCHRGHYPVSSVTVAKQEEIHDSFDIQRLKGLAYHEALKVMCQISHCSCLLASALPPLSVTEIKMNRSWPDSRNCFVYSLRKSYLLVDIFSSYFLLFLPYSLLLRDFMKAFQRWRCPLLEV